MKSIEEIIKKMINIIIKEFLDIVKNLFIKNSKFSNLLLKRYYKSLFFRKKHIKKKSFSWLKEIDIKILNQNEGKLVYKNLEFIIPKNELSSIPLSEKYLFAALIGYFNIPSYYLLFWDHLIIFREIFVENLYDKIKFIKKGDTIIDIGSSIGWYVCKIAELIGKNGKIIAIEPDPLNFKYLKRNIILNNVTNVTLFNIGIWSSKRKLFLASEKYASKIEIHVDSKKGHNFKLVEVDTIDNLSLNLEKIDLIKMDIEGAEIEAVKGAMNVLKSSNSINLIISAYHEIKKDIKTYKILLPILEKINFNIQKKYLPFIYASKEGNKN